MIVPKFISESRTASEIAFRPFLEAFYLERGFTLELDYKLGVYFPDFAIPSQKIIIEIDGSAHDKHIRICRDIKRNSWMRKRGWVTIRFTNQQVNINPGKCIDYIAHFLRSNLILKV